MDMIRLDLDELKTQEAALEKCSQIPNMPDYYAKNLDSLYEILSQWTGNLKIEIAIGNDPSPFGTMLGMLEDARVANPNLLFVVITKNK